MNATMTAPDPRFAAAVHRLALDLEADPRATRKTCPICRATFACLPGECWCASLRLSPNTLRTLQNQHANCLCPSCLMSYNES